MERARRKARSLCSGTGPSVWSGAAITLRSLATLIPAFHPLGPPRVFISHPKHVARRDPNQRRVLMSERNTQRGWDGEIEGRERKKEERTEKLLCVCQAPSASCHSRDVTVFSPPPSLFFPLSRQCLMSDLKLLSSFFPSSFSLSGGREHGSAECHVVLGWVCCVMWRHFWRQTKGKRVLITNSSHSVLRLF